MLKAGFKTLLAQANAVIETISVQDALQHVGGADAVFVDVREAHERHAAGGLRGSVHAPRGFLEFKIDLEGPLHEPALSSGKRLILYCASGGRSTFAAKTLQDMGLGNVCHMAGGINAWAEAGGPIEPPT